MDKDVIKRFKELEARLERLASQGAPLDRPVRGSDLDQGVLGGGSLCAVCQSRVDAALARAEAIAAALATQTRRGNQDVLERMVTQSMLGDLSSVAAHFRRSLSDAETRMSGIFDGLRSLGREIDTAIEQAEAFASATAAFEAKGSLSVIDRAPNPEGH